MTLELVSVFVEPKLSELLKPYFPDNHPKEFNNAFSILTSPLKLSFYRQEQLELINILHEPIIHQNQKLKKHQEKWHWILNSYLKGEKLSKDYFLNELNKMKKADFKILKSEIENYVDDIKWKKEKIINKINPSQEVLDYIFLVETFSTLQDDRKALNFQADFVLEELVDEVSKRTKIEKDDLKLLLPSEIADVFKNNLRQTIQLRKKSFATYCSDKVIEGMDGDEAEALSREFENAKDINESIIHGVLASSGEVSYFRGPAKIILTINELEKLNEGEILVTTMTSPDFVLAMKKAGAIITDVGGMLSHAAIVSREFKKPCIVGTGIATKVIKDGDIVELHCGRGTVKIIKQQS